MKKRISLLLAVLALLGGGAAAGLLYVGEEVERRFERAVASADAADNLHVKKVSFTKSLFGAEAVTEAGFDKVPMVLRFRHVISFKPSLQGPAEMNTTLELPSKAQTDLAPIFGGASPLTARTVLQWDRTAATEFSSPAFTALLRGGRTDWRGVTGTLLVNGNRIRAQVKIPGMTISDGTLDFSMRDLRFTADTSNAADGLWLGDSVLELGHLEGTSPPSGKVILKGVRLAQSVKEEAPGLLRIGLSLDAQEIAAADVAVTRAGYEVQLSRLDRKVVGAIAKRVKPSPGAVSQERAIALASRFVDDLPALLKRSPKVTLKRVSFTLPAGSFKANGTAEFSGQDELGVSKPLERMPPFKVKGHLEIGKPLLAWIVRQEMREPARMIGNAGDERSRWSDQQVERLAVAMSEMRIARAERKGALSDRAGTYAIDIAYEGGEVTVNGRPITDLMGMLADS